MWCFTLKTQSVYCAQLFRTWKMCNHEKNTHKVLMTVMFFYGNWWAKISARNRSRISMNCFVNTLYSLLVFAAAYVRYICVSGFYTNLSTHYSNIVRNLLSITRQFASRIRFLCTKNSSMFCSVWRHLENLKIIPDSLTADSVPTPELMTVQKI
jgi:ABC-type uncharacterized transport system permease subunit